MSNRRRGGKEGVPPVLIVSGEAFAALAISQGLPAPPDPLQYGAHDDEALVKEVGHEVQILTEEYGMLLELYRGLRQDLKRTLRLVPDYNTDELRGALQNVMVLDTEERVLVPAPVLETEFIGLGEGHTLGFSLTFRGSHRQRAEATDKTKAHLPFLRPLLETMLQPECNCFFLTFLWARADGQRYHTDNYFENFCGYPRPSDVVSVAYLEADEEAMVGGELVVLKASAEEAGPVRIGNEASGQVLQMVRPSPGLVVDFDGRLLHGIRPFTGPARVSAVLEQCRLPRQIARRTPRLRVFCQRSNEEVTLA
ncbi:unnamed protein product [Symbiodinium pilosum]|uniref:Fe2OG dioxygenase domain-containing protein n=1 Tax=Symbiodinium pilosum TaxID=2952 RepID=A0A812R9X6_SYMPI|nr:unnamed protein product [Symbiodinium pilosum]